jgi:hypothetical protein
MLGFSSYGIAQMLCQETRYGAGRWGAAVETKYFHFASRAVEDVVDMPAGTTLQPMERRGRDSIQDLAAYPLFSSNTAFIRSE